MITDAAVVKIASKYSSLAARAGASTPAMLLAFFRSAIAEALVDERRSVQTFVTCWKCGAMTLEGKACSHCKGAAHPALEPAPPQ